MKGKLKYIYILAAVIVVIIYVLLAVFSFTSPPKEGKPGEQLISTPTKRPESPLDKVQKKSEQGTPLTNREKQIREQFTQRAAKNGGVVYAEETFSVLYLPDYDTFQLRILSSDIAETEEKALVWLKEQGLSMNGICKLPVLYYINPRLVPSATEFKSIPKECE